MLLMRVMASSIWLLTAVEIWVCQSGPELRPAGCTMSVDGSSWGMETAEKEEKSNGAAKSPEPPSLQKMQPRVPRVPSRLGQVMRPSRAIL